MKACIILQLHLSFVWIKHGISDLHLWTKRFDQSRSSSFQLPCQPVTYRFSDNTDHSSEQTHLCYHRTAWKPTFHSIQIFKLITATKAMKHWSHLSNVRGSVDRKGKTKRSSRFVFETSTTLSHFTAFSFPFSQRWEHHSPRITFSLSEHWNFIALSLLPTIHHVVRNALSRDNDEIFNKVCPLYFFPLRKRDDTTLLL